MTTLTKNEIENYTKSERFAQSTETGVLHTLCYLTLNNGFTVTGVCRIPQSIGEHVWEYRDIARQDAFEKVRMLYAFLDFQTEWENRIAWEDENCEEAPASEDDCPLAACRSPHDCAERDTCDFADGHPANDALRAMGEMPNPVNVEWAEKNRGTDAMWISDMLLKTIRDIGSTPALSQAAGHVEYARDAIRKHFN